MPTMDYRFLPHVTGEGCEWFQGEQGRMCIFFPNHMTPRHGPDEEKCNVNTWGNGSQSWEPIHVNRKSGAFSDVAKLRAAGM